MDIAAKKAAPEIRYGNNFGPTGSAKKGFSNCVALAKNANATTAIMMANGLAPFNKVGDDFQSYLAQVIAEVVVSD